MAKKGKQLKNTKSDIPSGKRNTVPEWQQDLQQYVGPLRGFFAKRVARQQDVDDLVQEVFVRLLKRKSSRSIKQIKPYLFQTAANVLCDWGRKGAVRAQNAHESFDESVHASSEISPVHVLQGKEELRLLTSALNELPVRMRDIFVLRTYERMKIADVAELMGISTRAVEKNMAKALVRLNSALSGNE